MTAPKEVPNAVNVSDADLDRAEKAYAEKPSLQRSHRERLRAALLTQRAEKAEAYLRFIDVIDGAVTEELGALVSPTATDLHARVQSAAEIIERLAETSRDLAAQRAAHAREDTARLDWLDTARVMLVPQWFASDGAPAWLGMDDRKHATLREAIDASRAALSALGTPGAPHA